MENLWLLYSLGGLLFLWLADFSKKVMLKKWWDKDVFLFTSFIFFILALFINFISHFNLDAINYDLIKPALIIGFFDFITPIWMLAALKYLDTSFAFISTRLTSSFLILFIWVYILWDHLSFFNLSWFFLWIIALFLLSGFSLKQKHNINLKWVLGVLLALVWMVSSHSYFKYVVNDIDINTFVFLKFLFSFVFLIIYMLFRKKFKTFNKIEVKKIIPYSLISCFLFITYSLYILPQIYILWTLSLSYKILSYSLFIPIILSLIIYKEEISKRKIFALFLTVISVSLFII